MDKLKMHSVNKVDDNIKKIGALFPNTLTEVIKGNREDGTAIVEQAIDFDILRQELSGEVVEGQEERYQFTWPDKRKSILLANAPIAKTLRPCREESEDFDNTENLYIEGDNLDALKLLQETYLGKIKMIYIDPPYNTGNDFVYEDDFAQSSDEYLANSGQFDEEGNRLVQNTESNGRFHTDWLNMIYPRLKLAKDLLTDDGAFFISCDDNEVDNLKKICNEVFGNLNFVGCIVKKTKLTSNNGTYFAPSHEYVLIYAKNINLLPGFNDPLAQEDPEYLKLFKYEDSYSKYNIVGLYQPSLTLERSRNARYYIICPDGSKCIPPEGKRWRVIERSYFEMLDKDLIVFKETKTSPLIDENANQSKWNIYTKIYLKDRLDSGMRPNTFLDKFPNSEASKELIKLNIPFDFSKPRRFIQYLVQICGCKGGIVLDFFSGSATTAHAVMQLNAEDGGNRKFIMVQLPEATDGTSEAFKAGYKNICEIGKERIRRSGHKIKNEAGIYAQQLDVGFRVLKVDSTNMEEVYYSPTEYNQDQIEMFADNIKPDRSPEDLLFQVMLDLGVLLFSKIKETTIGGQKVFNVADGYLLACFDNNVTDKVITEIAKKQPYYAVFRDSSMASDSVAANFEQIFATYSPSTVRKVL